MEDKEVPTWITVMAGGTTGMVTKALSQPLDVIKIRLQLQVEPLEEGAGSKYTGSWQAFRRILREEGLRALWKGHIPAQQVAIVTGIFQFGVNDLIRKTASKYPELDDKKDLTEFVGGFISGATSTFVSFPLEVLRTRLVAQGHPKIYSGVGQALSLMWRCEGMKGFTRGLTPALIQVGIASGLHFTAFTRLKRMLKETSLIENETALTMMTQSLVAGSASGMLCKLLLYPLDLAEKRMQLQGFSTNNKPGRNGFGKNFTCSSMFDCIKTTIKVEGVFGLYKGLKPGLIKSAITSGLTFMLYDSSRCYLYKIYQD